MPVHALSTCGLSWIVYSHRDCLLPALDSQLLVADFYFIAACPVLIPVLGFRVVLPLLLCLLVIDLVCSTMNLSTKCTALLYSSTGLHAHTALTQPICYHWTPYDAHPRHCTCIICCTFAQLSAAQPICC